MKNAAHRNFKRLDLWVIGWLTLAEGLACVISLGWRLPMWAMRYAMKAGSK